MITHPVFNTSLYIKSVIDHSAMALFITQCANACCSANIVYHTFVCVAYEVNSNINRSISARRALVNNYIIVHSLQRLVHSLVHIVLIMMN